MRVLVCGGRDFDDEEFVFTTLNDLDDVSLIIHGGARGADSLAEVWADANGVRCRSFKADWNDLSHSNARIRTRPDGSQYDANAGKRRNKEMLEIGKPDLVIAFHGNYGTMDMIKQAMDAGIEVRIPAYEG